MKSRFLLLCCWLWLGAVAVFGQGTAKPKYNVLFIMADDMRPELGTYGDKIIQTPTND